jgi:hypothetical protein
MTVLQLVDGRGSCIFTFLYAVLLDYSCLIPADAQPGHGQAQTRRTSIHLNPNGQLDFTPGSLYLRPEARQFSKAASQPMEMGMK